MSIGENHLVSAFQRSAEFKIFIKDEIFQSQDVEIEAVELICQFGFSELDLQRIFSQLIASDSRVISIYKKIDFFKHETVINEVVSINSKYSDLLVMTYSRLK